MASVQNFDNGTQEFNIALDSDGHLRFKANDRNGAGDTRMIIADNSGEVTIGGSGVFGQIQLKGATDTNTVFIGGADDEATVLLGGASGQYGRVRLFDASGRETVDLDGKKGGLAIGSEGVEGDLSILNSSGTTAIRMAADRPSLRLADENGTRVDIDGETGSVELKNADGVTTVLLSSVSGLLRLGGEGTTGDIELDDRNGDLAIDLSGSTGTIECGFLYESGVVPLPRAAAPLTKALERVLALRGVQAASDDVQRIGLVGEELAAVFPELVATNAAGRSSINYSRLGVVLVEAIKEQQQLIVEQAARLAEASQRLANIEASIASSAAAQ